MLMPPGGQMPGSGPMHGGPHIPGVYPPASLANDLLHRERERLERLGMPVYITCFIKFVKSAIIDIRPIYTEF